MSVVTFRPIGRLANNMFQTAACIGYAKQYGYEWRVPVERYPGDTDPWLLTKFWPNLPTTERRWIGERYEQHDPKDFNYKSIKNLGSLTLVGFFQSEKWFQNAKDEVKQAFPLKQVDAGKGAVSIHVRRGDYVQHPNSFPPITNEYINKALECIPINERKYIVVFSDDIDWCFNNLRFNVDGIVGIVYSRDGNEYDDLSWMASCSHHIIANSTFSWFGAWLGHNPNKIIVSPHYTQWFGPAWTGKPPVDIIPDSWIQIKI